MKRIWVVYSYYENKIESIHKTRKEAIAAKRIHDQARICRFEVSVRYYIKHNGGISEIRKYEYDDYSNQFMWVIE